MAFFAGPSFQDGKGSFAALDMPLIPPMAAIAADVLSKSLRLISIRILFLVGRRKGCGEIRTRPTAPELPLYPTERWGVVSDYSEGVLVAFLLAPEQSAKH